MHNIKRDLDGVVCLIDNVLVFGKDKAEHTIRLYDLLNRFCAANLTLNKKYGFAKSYIKFAGHVVPGNGISSNPDRLAATFNMAPHADVSGMRCSLGITN